MTTPTTSLVPVGKHALLKACIRYLENREKKITIKSAKALKAAMDENIRSWPASIFLGPKHRTIDEAEKHINHRPHITCSWYDASILSRIKAEGSDTAKRVGNMKIACMKAKGDTIYLSLEDMDIIGEWIETNERS